MGQGHCPAPLEHEMPSFPYIAALKAEIIALKDAAVEAYDAISQLVEIAVNGPPAP